MYVNQFIKANLYDTLGKQLHLAFVHSIILMQVQYH